MVEESRRLALLLADDKRELLQAAHLQALCAEHWTDELVQHDERQHVESRAVQLPDQRR